MVLAWKVFQVPFVLCSQWVRLGCGLWWLCVLSRSRRLSCCVLSRSRRLSFPRACVVWLHWFLNVFWLVMGSDGFQTQEKKSWVSGQVRAERVLAEAITIDGRKEWTCKFCSESNVWTRWRWRRCYHNIPAALYGKYGQAVAAKGEWSTGSSRSSGEEERKARSLEAENEELRARIDLEGVWEDCMEVEDEDECRRKLDVKRKKIQTEQREVERLSFASKETQENLTESMQH